MTMGSCVTHWYLWGVQGCCDHDSLVCVGRAAGVEQGSVGHSARGVVHGDWKGEGVVCEVVSLCCSAPSLILYKEKDKMSIIHFLSVCVCMCVCIPGGIRCWQVTRHAFPCCVRIAATDVVFYHCACLFTTTMFAVV